MLSGDVRHAIARAVAAAGLAPADPGLRPTGTPGQYGSSVAFALGEPAGPVAARLAALLAGSGPVARAEVTGPGFITITVSPQALADLPGRVISAGPACATGDALHGRTVPAPPPGDPLAAPGWEEAREALAAQLTARLAAAAGATVELFRDPERTGLAPDAGQSAVDGAAPARSSAPGPAPHATGQRRETDVAAAVAFAGADAVRFSLARAVPGRPVAIDPLLIARQVTGNPAYAVRYAHARAVAEERWAAGAPEPVPAGNPRWPAGPPAAVPAGNPRWPAGPISLPSIGPAGQRTGGYGGSPPREITVLLDALGWLPEMVAAAARRGRPDEFARYLEGLARATLAALAGAGSHGTGNRAGNPGGARVPGADRLALAGAARTGLAAGLGLLAVSAPDRL